jgi:hypothetical protein
MPQSDVRNLMQLLWPATAGTSTWVYAILDGARNPRIHRALQEFEGDYRCLYRGQLSARLQRAAPYLVRLVDVAPFSRWLLEQAWGDSWGIFLQARSEIDDLRRHFRRFLVVEDYRGRRLYFRYYDPRVLRVYLPTCVGMELTTVFGPVERFVVEDENPNVALEFRRRQGRLVTARHTLSTVKSQPAAENSPAAAD